MLISKCFKNLVKTNYFQVCVMIILKMSPKMFYHFFYLGIKSLIFYYGDTINGGGRSSGGCLSGG